jgi:hypothetical protein
MLKRIFWLALAGVGVWMLYRFWQQHQDDFGGTTPLLAPLEPYGRHIPSAVTTPSNHDTPRSATTTAPPAREAEPPENPPADPQGAAAGDLEGITGYCARCKARRSISDPHEETTESGRRAARGTCPVCGAKMFTFLSNKTS